MIITPAEYAIMFTFNKKKVSVQTVRKRCKDGNLPSDHKVRLLKGVWAIQIPDDVKLN